MRRLSFGHELPNPPQGESAELEDLLDEVAPPELDIQEDFPQPVDSDYEPSIRPHDPLDDDVVPECPPPSDDEGPLSDGPHEVEQGVGAIVSIASDFKNSLPNEDIQNVFGVVLSQAGRTGCLGASAKPFEATKGHHTSSGGRVLFEFCCDEESNLGKVGEEHGIQVVRLCKESIDLSDDLAIDQLCEQIKAMPGCSIHGSIECRPWSTWQRLNMKKHPRLCEMIAKDREESLRMIARFIRVADIVLAQGGHVSYEWPRFCAGWTEEPLASWISSKQLYSACFPGCAVGVRRK